MFFLDHRLLNRDSLFNHNSKKPVYRSINERDSRGMSLINKTATQAFVFTSPVIGMYMF